ncbi:MAG: DUF58 domain-containing protein [Candidatus Babeliales bacterium]
MLNKEQQKKIKRIQLQTKRLLTGHLVGDYRTNKKGFGLEFEQLGEYQFGDDIRFIDWKSSARTNKMLIKEYKEERNRTIIIIMDGSQSTWYGSNYTKKERMQEIVSSLTLAAVHGKDHVGLIMVTDEVETYMAPKNSIKYGYQIIEKIFNFESKSKKTKLQKAFEHVMRVQKSDALVFVVSDFIDEDIESKLPILAKKHDVVAIRCLDNYEKNIPQYGFIHCNDLETGEEIVLNMKNMSSLQERITKQNNIFKKNRIDCLDIDVNKTSIIEDIIYFFNKRLKH